jgi:hypothetical protein
MNTEEKKKGNFNFDVILIEPIGKLFFLGSLIVIFFDE